MQAANNAGFLRRECCLVQTFVCCLTALVLELGEERERLVRLEKAVSLTLQRAQSLARLDHWTRHGWQKVCLQGTVRATAVGSRSSKPAGKRSRGQANVAECLIGFSGPGPVAAQRRSYLTYWLPKELKGIRQRAESRGFAGHRPQHRACCAKMVQSTHR